MTVSTKNNSTLISVTEAAGELGLTVGRIRQLLLDAESKLVGMKIGSNWCIDRKDLEKFKKVTRKPGNPNFQKKFG